MKAPDQFQRHAKIIGKILIVVALLHLVASSFIYNAIYFFDGWEPFDDIHVGVFTLRHPVAFLYSIPFFYVALALTEFLIAAGILAGQRWAQKLSMVLGFFYFFNFPLGTALSVYIFLTFWETPSGQEINSGHSQESPQEKS